jgi:isopentenyldiphosphate isomerase
MDSENLNIFSKDRTRIGVSSRAEVHKKGYWHEAFHCWFMSKVDEINYLDLQLRSKNKKRKSLPFGYYSCWSSIITRNSM